MEYAIRCRANGTHQGRPTDPTVVTGLEAADDVDAADGPFGPQRYRGEPAERRILIDALVDSVNILCDRLTVHVAVAPPFLVTLHEVGLTWIVNPWCRRPDATDLQPCIGGSRSSSMGVDSRTSRMTDLVETQKATLISNWLLCTSSHSSRQGMINSKNLGSPAHASRDAESRHSPTDKR